MFFSHYFFKEKENDEQVLFLRIIGDYRETCKHVGGLIAAYTNKPPGEYRIKIPAAPRRFLDYLETRLQNLPGAIINNNRRNITTSYDALWKATEIFLFTNI